MKKLAPIFEGNEKYAYRDPACVYANGRYNLFFTFSEKDSGYMYNYIALSKSVDLKNWSEPRLITPKDRSLNFTSPGSITKVGDKYIITICTYPMKEPYAKYPYADDSARIYTIATGDFDSFTSPQLVLAKGDMPPENMGRMIDAFIFADKDKADLYHLLFKQDGRIASSHSCDLEHWVFDGFVHGGENPCVVTKDNFYYIIYSPNDDGIGFRRSCNLAQWEELGVTTLAREDWAFASGRITAGFAMELPDGSEHRYALFFHGSVEGTYPETHGNASLAYVFTDDFESFCI